MSGPTRLLICQLGLYSGSSNDVHVHYIVNRNVSQFHHQHRHCHLLCSRKPSESDRSMYVWYVYIKRSINQSINQAKQQDKAR